MGDFEHAFQAHAVKVHQGLNKLLGQTLNAGIGYLFKFANESFDRLNASLHLFSFGHQAIPGA
jgi:hypothetical protein